MFSAASLAPTHEAAPRPDLTGARVYVDWMPLFDELCVAHDLSEAAQQIGYQRAVARNGGFRVRHDYRAQGSDVLLLEGEHPVFGPAQVPMASRFVRARPTLPTPAPETVR